LGIEYGIAEDVTPEDTWKGQLNDTNNWEDLAYQQAQLLENPNSTPESVYGALGLSQTGNAYFDAINRSGARSGALNAMQDAKGSTAARDAATQGFTKETTDYMNAMKDIESRWDTAGAATQGELDKGKTALKTGLETKDIGKTSEADITAKAETLAKAEAKAKGIKETNAANSEYMKLLQKNKDLYGKQVKSEVEAAAKQEKLRKENDDLQKRGHSPESASAIQKAAEDSGQPVEVVEKEIQRLTDEEVEKYIKAYGDAADNVGVVNKVLGAVSMIFPSIQGSGLAALGGLVAQKVLSSKQKKYQEEQKRRKDATDSDAKRERLATEADNQNVQDAEAKKAGKANRDATNDALAKSGSIGRAKVAM
jgi:rRNA processing protein Gar1